MDQDHLNLPISRVDRTFYEVVVLKLPEAIKIINSSISIQNSEIMGSINLNCIFLNSVNFNGTKFYKYADFKGAKFRDTANFRGTLIKEGAAFCGTEFGKGVNGANQPLDYIWFSITVAVTPGFAGFQPASGLFQVVAGLEAIFGTFMWAAFIATFAWKYMR